jgi:hypothetical protein
MAEFKALTEGEFNAITRRTARKRSRQLLALDARYDEDNGRLMITLNNGAIVGFPLSACPGLERAGPDDLREIEVDEGGYGLHIQSLDADISVPQLLADELGSVLMKRTIVRRNASRANGRLGGRPRRRDAA